MRRESFNIVARNQTARHTRLDDVPITSSLSRHDRHAAGHRFHRDSKALHIVLARHRATWPNGTVASVHQRLAQPDESVCQASLCRFLTELPKKQFMLRCGLTGNACGVTPGYFGSSRIMASDEEVGRLFRGRMRPTSEIPCPGNPKGFQRGSPILRRLKTITINTMRDRGNNMAQSLSSASSLVAMIRHPWMPVTAGETTNADAAPQEVITRRIRPPKRCLIISPSSISLFRRACQIRNGLFSAVSNRPERPSECRPTEFQEESVMRPWPTVQASGYAEQAF